jgi:FtsH-binding integral membrane protein
MGGKDRKYQCDEDDYILAAVMLYLDIINLFLYILELLARK